MTPTISKRTNKKTKPKLKLAVADIETDPFLYGRVPMPFTCGFYDGENYVDFWGDDCIAELMEYIDQLEESYRIYIHNGGGFDFWFMQDFITNPLFFINKRIAKCGLLDRHELRDSYRMIPIALAKYNKESIDYSKFEEGVRHKHKKEILGYQFLDCKYLFDMVTDFITRYGDHLTIGSAALKHLKKFHPNNHEHQFYDMMFRPYYMGGRNQCFKFGELKGDFKIYDVNSLYPHTMRDFAHPAGNQYKVLSRLPDNGNVYFAKIIAESKGALPIRTKTGLDFPHGEHEFFACSHEILQAKKLGLLKVKKVIECREFRESQRFDKYVDTFVAEKIRCEETGDKGGREFAKLFLNSAYGKFGQDPNKYRDHEIFDTIEQAELSGYNISTTFGDRLLGEKPCEIKPWSFNNVAIAASITSAARAVLLRGLHNAVNPVYCDTDSIVCETLNEELHATKLGAWKNEGSADRIFIAGKKLYAAYLGEECVKKASKGVQLDGKTISEVATTTKSVAVPIHAPVLRFAQQAKFIERNIRATC